MAKKELAIAESDNRKFDVGDVLEYMMPNQADPFINPVHSVQYTEDKDGIRHSYKYLMDTGEFDETTGGTDTDGNPVGQQPVFHLIDSGDVIRKV